jgi:hypothetical protein
VILCSSKLILLFLDEFDVSGREIHSVWRWIMKETHPTCSV